MKQCRLAAACGPHNGNQMAAADRKINVGQFIAHERGKLISGRGVITCFCSWRRVRIRFTAVELILVNRSSLNGITPGKSAVDNAQRLSSQQWFGFYFIQRIFISDVILHLIGQKKGSEPAQTDLALRQSIQQHGEENQRKAELVE